MSLRRASFRSVIDASLCRRRQPRQRWFANVATTWLPGDRPTKVSVIEADVRGARLMLPFHVQTDDRVQIAFEDDLGLFQTRTARIAWTQSLEAAGKIVVGVAFDRELDCAA